MTASQTGTAVLLVEDDDQDAFLFEKMLREEAGATRIDRAVEGAAALRLIGQSGPYDCIVLDLRLSGEDGLWLLEHLNAKPDLASIPVIVFSGDAARLQQACAAFPNVVSSVRKPETLEQYRTALTIVGAILHAAVDVGLARNRCIRLQCLPNSPAQLICRRMNRRRTSA